MFRDERGRFKKGHPGFLVQSNATSFKKGNIPWNKGKKGIHFSPETEFKKGMVSPKRGEKSPEMQWENHPNFKGGRWSIRRKMIREGVDATCQICGVEKDWSDNKIQIHHIDKDKGNNESDNILILCSKCHLGGHLKERRSGCFV